MFIDAFDMTLFEENDIEILQYATFSMNMATYNLLVLDILIKINICFKKEINDYSAACLVPFQTQIRL